MEQAESTNHQGEAKAGKAEQARIVWFSLAGELQASGGGQCPKDSGGSVSILTWSSRWTAGWRTWVVLGMESETGYVDGLWGKS